MLFLLGDNNDNTTISKEYIEIACKLMEDYFVINACALLEDIARDEKNNLQDKIISILKTYGRTSVRDIMRYAHQSKKDLADALDALDDNGSFEIKKTKEGKTIYYELNGSHSSVMSVATVATVATVPFVANNQGINATNVTIQEEHRCATPFQSTSCDKSDKSDDCDRRDSCDNSRDFKDKVISKTIHDVLNLYRDCAEISPQSRDLEAANIRVKFNLTQEEARSRLDAEIAKVTA